MQAQSKIICPEERKETLSAKKQMIDGMQQLTEEKIEQTSSPQ